MDKTIRYSFFFLHQDAFEARQRTCLDPHALSDLRVRVRFDAYLAAERLTERINLGVFEWLRISVEAHEPRRARDLQNAQFVANLDADSNISVETAACAT